MATATGQCPKCGVKFNARVSSIGTVKRCQACGERFILRMREATVSAQKGGKGWLYALVAGGVGYYVYTHANTSSAPPLPPPKPSLIVTPATTRTSPPVVKEPAELVAMRARVAALKSKLDQARLTNDTDAKLEASKAYNDARQRLTVMLELNLRK